MALVLRRSQRGVGGEATRSGAGRRAGGLVLPHRLLLPLLVLASGCFGYQEELWLYPNHSGRLEGKLRVPGEVWRRTEEPAYAQWRRLDERLTALAGRVDGVRLATFQETSTSRNYRANWAFDFDSPEALQGLLEEEAALALAVVPDADVWGRPDVHVERLGRLTNIRRSFPPLPAPQGLPTDGEPSLEIAFLVHTPFPVLSAPGAMLADERRAATWSVHPNRFVRDGLDMRLSYRKPVPLIPLIGTLGGFALGVCAIWSFALLHMTKDLRQAQAAAPAAPRARPTGGEPPFGKADHSEFVDDWTEP